MVVTSLAITTPLTFSKTWRAQNSNFCVQHTPSYLPASLCTCQLHALHVSASRTARISFTHCTYQLHAPSDPEASSAKRNLKSFGDRSFSFIVPSCVVFVPASLRNVPTRSGFKSRLKTFSLDRPVHKAGQAMSDKRPPVCQRVCA